MLYTELTNKAMNISYEAHHGAKDKNGVPYVFHPFHVAEQMDGEYEICVALLHDVIEDTDYTVSDLQKAGFPDEVIEAVEVITRPKGMPYLDYIRAVKKNKIATKVKLADLEHNSDKSRLKTVDDKSKERLLKYAASMDILRGNKEE